MNWNPFKLWNYLKRAYLINLIIEVIIKNISTVIQTMGDCIPYSKRQLNAKR